MPGRLAYLNGEFVAEADARVSVFDSALNFGDMVFESIRTFRHAPFKMREHLERLDDSLQLLEIDCGLSLDDLEELTQKTLERNIASEAEDVDWQIVINISRGPLPAYRAAFQGGLRPTVCIHCWPLIPQLGRFAGSYDSGIDLICSSQLSVPAHVIDPRAKTRSRAHYRLALLEAAQAGGNVWPVLFDPDGYLAEGPGWNVFLVKNGTILTPAPRNILPGISRAITIDLARDLEIEVHETDLRQEDALQADEIFCTATSFCIVHAASIEGNQLPHSTPGPIVHKLRPAWQRTVGLDFIAQARSYAGRLGEWEATEAAAWAGSQRTGENSA